MATTIGSNISSITAQRLLALNESGQRTSLLRLSSGLRINSSGDDAAGLAVSSSLTAKSRVYTQGIRNANDGISALAIADGTLSQLSDVVTRIKELATSSANGSLGRLQRVSNDKEASALTDEFNRLVASTTFNGRKLLDGQLGELALQLGFGTDERISARLGNELRRNGLRDYSSSASVNFGVATGGTDAQFADVNGDGHIDVFMGDDSATTYLALGNGDGTFQAATVVGASTAGITSSIALGDINGDGRVDLIEGVNDGLGGGGIFISLGNGNGTFQTASTLSSSPTSQVALGDLNGDGRLDLISSGTTGAISTRLGTGSGTFGSAVATSLTSNGGTRSFALGDLNGDSKLDIAVGAASGLISALGTGLGTFQSGVTLASSGSNSSISLADFNSDGILDVSSMRGSNVYLYQGSGTGTFASGTSLGTAANTVLATDLNGDGEMDIVTGTALGKTLAFFGNGSGSFTQQNFSAGTIQGAADLNEDGVMDIVSANQGYLANTDYTTNLQKVDLTTRAGALNALDALDAVMRRLALERGALGSIQSRLSAGVSTLLARVENYDAANARITNADIAQESAELIKRRILTQVGASVLAQANQAPALALTLLT